MQTWWTKFPGSRDGPGASFSICTKHSAGPCSELLAIEVVAGQQMLRVTPVQINYLIRLLDWNMCNVTAQFLVSCLVRLQSLLVFLISSCYPETVLYWPNRVLLFDVLVSGPQIFIGCENIYIKLFSNLLSKCLFMVHHKLLLFSCFRFHWSFFWVELALSVIYKCCLVFTPAFCRVQTTVSSSILYCWYRLLRLPCSHWVCISLLFFSMFDQNDSTFGQHFQAIGVSLSTHFWLVQSWEHNSGHPA